jgi:hypothetical protein
MEPETEIVVELPGLPLRHKRAKKTVSERHEAVMEMTTNRGAQRETEACNDAPAQEQAHSPIVTPEGVRRLSDEGQAPEEEMRELTVEKRPLNPRLVLASYEEGGVKRVVKVWVGANRNFRPRMVLKARRGPTEYEPWTLVGRRPRLPGRW